MLKMGVAMAGALMLGACGGGERADNQAAANAAAANAAADATNYQEAVLKLPPEQLDGVFLRAIRDAGLNCQEVTQTERFDPVDGNPAWRVYCDKTPHLISITRDGTARIISRTDAR